MINSINLESLESFCSIEKEIRASVKSLKNADTICQKVAVQVAYIFYYNFRRYQDANKSIMETEVALRFALMTIRARKLQDVAYSVLGCIAYHINHYGMSTDTACTSTSLALLDGNGGGDE